LKCCIERGFSKITRKRSPSNLTMSAQSNPDFHQVKGGEVDKASPLLGFFLKLEIYPPIPDFH